VSGRAAKLQRCTSNRHGCQHFRVGRNVDRHYPGEVGSEGLAENDNRAAKRDHKHKLCRAELPKNPNRLFD
jgi:hypothetical protein